MEQKRRSQGWRRLDAWQSSRGPIWLTVLLSLAGNIEVTKLPQRGFGQIYHLRYIAPNGRWASMIIVARTCSPSIGKELRLSFHLANRSVLAYLRAAVEQNIPVFFVGDVVIADNGGKDTRIQLAIPYHRVAPAIDTYINAGGSARVPLNVLLVRESGSIKATLVRAGNRMDVSDCLGLHLLRAFLPTPAGAEVRPDQTQFTAQYQLFAILANSASVTMDAADVGRRENHSITSRLGLSPVRNISTRSASGLRRADILALKGTVLTEDGFQPPCGPSSVLIAEIEADGGKAEVGRKLIDRLYDAMELGASADTIHLYAVVPAHHKHAVEAELQQRLQRHVRSGMTPVAAVRVWSTVEIDLAYGCLVGSPSAEGARLLGRLREAFA